VKVIDRDPVYVLNAAQEAAQGPPGGVDAPECGQPFGKRSKERMAELEAGQEVTVDWYKTDRRAELWADPDPVPPWEWRWR
jgi:endonuclease YncB( thermonuclease family)